MSDNILPVRQNDVFANVHNPYMSDSRSNPSTARSSHEIRLIFACPFAKAYPTQWIWECGLVYWPADKLKDGLRHHLLAANSSHRRMHAECGHGDPRHVDDSIFMNLDQWIVNTKRKAWDGKGAVQTWTAIYNICRGLPSDAANTTINPYWSKNWVRETMNGDADSHFDPTSLPQREAEIDKIEDAVRVMRQLAAFAKKRLRAGLSKVKQHIGNAVQEFHNESERSIHKFQQRWHHQSKRSNVPQLGLDQRPEHDLQGFGQPLQEKAAWGEIAPFPVTVSPSGMEVLVPQFTITSPADCEPISQPAFETVLGQYDLQEFTDDYRSLSNMQQNPDQGVVTQFSPMPQQYPQQSNGQQYFPVDSTSHFAQAQFSKPQFLVPDFPGRPRSHSMNNIPQSHQFPQSPRPRSFHGPPSQPFQYNDTTQPQLNPGMINPNMLGVPWAEPQARTQQHTGFGQSPQTFYDQQDHQPSQW